MYNRRSPPLQLLSFLLFSLLFIHSFILSFFFSFTHSLIHTLTHSWFHSIIRSFILSFILTFFNSFFHPFFPSFLPLSWRSRERAQKYQGGVYTIMYIRRTPPLLCGPHKSIRAVTPSSTCLYDHVQPEKPSVTLAFFSSFIHFYWYTHSFFFFTLSFILSLTHSLFLEFIHSFVHSFFHSFLHSLIHSLINSFLHFFYFLGVHAIEHPSIKAVTP